ncbi:Aste57867_1076 [Aphanomyces stellatus]|uniref:Aste57867_1076 protein n=1 Tax=Aphanomyces stellatus TaxID=120398 RepID=A0A485K4A6_9STRA|nr:hypothetical protein As57867_001075 [Aphanomyces stellatus]VFT78298.1 Aste57867_1076 [Aphanomyces stellatus]
MKISLLSAFFALVATTVSAALTNEIIADGKVRTPEQLKAIEEDGDVNRKCHTANDGYVASLKPGSYQASKYHNCFRTSTQIYEYLDVLVKQNPTVLTKFPISKSVTGQTIYGFKLATKPLTKSIYVESLIHAREWITGSSTVYALSRWLDDIAAGKPTPADLFNLYLVPLVNPDGYDISWSGKRYQRKNKNEVDLNRNFISKFPNPDPPSPADQDYPGTAPFSEPETAGIAKFTTEHKDELFGYVDIHSNAHSVLYPYGDTFDPIGGGEDEKFIKLGKNMVKAMNSSLYITEASGALYLAYGCFDDYHYRSTSKPTLTLEMYGEDFVVPYTSIPQRGDEIYRGIASFFEEVRDFNGTATTVAPTPAPTAGPTPAPTSAPVTTKPAC